MSFRDYLYSHPYVTAASAGVLLGIVATINQGFFDFIGNETSWGIPLWEKAVRFKSPPLVDLEMQALWLRTCYVFLDHGLSNIAIAVLAACGLVKVTDLGKSRPIFRICSRTVWFWIWCCVVIGVLGFLLGVGTGNVSKTGLEVFFNCYQGMLLFIDISNSWLITPFFVLMYFLFQVARHFGFFARDASRKRMRVRLTAAMGLLTGIIFAVISADDNVGKLFYVYTTPDYKGTIDVYHRSIPGTGANVALARQAENLLFWQTFISQGSLIILSTLSVFLALRFIYESRLVSSLLAESTEVDPATGVSTGKVREP